MVSAKLYSCWLANSFSDMIFTPFGCADAHLGLIMFNFEHLRRLSNRYLTPAPRGSGGRGPSAAKRTRRCARHIALIRLSSRANILLAAALASGSDLNLPERRPS